MKDFLYPQSKNLRVKDTDSGLPASTTYSRTICRASLSSRSPAKLDDNPTSGRIRGLLAFIYGSPSIASGRVTQRWMTKR